MQGPDSDLEKEATGHKARSNLWTAVMQTLVSLQPESVPRGACPRLQVQDPRSASTGSDAISHLQQTFLLFPFLLQLLQR
jgi:hypothetical protein